MIVCRRCQAPIIWVPVLGMPGGYSPEGRLMPLDAEPVVGGNVHVKPGSWFAYVLPPDMFEAARRTLVPMHLSHYVTCQRSGRPTECEAQ